MKNVFNIPDKNRRNFIVGGLKLALVAGVTGISLLSACKEKESEIEEGEGQKVSPAEDLMQEHGLLNRILLIYDTCKMQLINNQSFQSGLLLDAAQIIRSFVEDYHEKQEENYLFPRFEKENKLIDLVGTLRKQHEAGRIITDKIMQLARQKTLAETENKELIQLLASFNMMYRPHEAREDTVLFPAFRKIVSKNEYDSLGEEFEKNERRLFGEDGFETMVEKVVALEKKLGIYDLAQFTPAL